MRTKENISVAPWMESRVGHGGYIKSMRILITYQFSSVTQSYPTLCNPMDCSTPGFPVYHQLLNITQIHVYPVPLCCPLLLPSSVFPSIRILFSESSLHIRWPKYWNFNFSISPFTEYSGLISSGLIV